MDYKIEKKDAFRIVGFATKEAMTMEDCFEKVPAFCAKVAAEGGMPRICELFDGSDPQGVLGVSTCENGVFDSYFLAAATQKPVPEGMDEYTIPAGTWAVFSCVGAVPEAIQKLQQRIITEWLPSSGYEYAAAPDVEVYFEGDQSSPDYRSEVWLPIVKK